MAIDVTCPNCHTRFQVSDKFAGKSGPCPKCKTTIKVPDKSQEVVIHAPEVSGPTDSKGQAVLKPIARTEVRLQAPQIAAIVGSVLVVFIVAFVLRLQYKGGPVPPVILILGSVLLGPPLAFAGYTFLRDDELEPFRGTEVLLRSLACGLAYAAIWGAYWFIFAYLNPKPPSGWQPNWQIMCAVAPIMIALGAFAAQASLEFELTTGALHYALYLSATVLLRVIMMGPQAAHWVPKT
jgi:predicted Zn finger-like uncharacterized protein